MKLLNIISFILIAFLIVSCHHASESECRKFRTGEFYLSPKKASITFVINRNDSTQVETEKESGKTSEWRITWLSDCKYKLVLVNDNFGYLSNNKEIPALTFEIIKTSEDYYVFKQEFELFKDGFVDTIWKAK